MAHKFSYLKEEVYRDPARRQRIEEMHRAGRMALALQELRERRGETQVGLAGKLATTQHNISRVEHAENLYLSTLRDYVGALGGELKIIAQFPDGDVLLEPVCTSGKSAHEADG